MTAKGISKLEAARRQLSVGSTEHLAPHHHGVSPRDGYIKQFAFSKEPSSWHSSPYSYLLKRRSSAIDFIKSSSGRLGKQPLVPSRTKDRSASPEGQKVQSQTQSTNQPHYGERLVGCIECNRWGRPGDARLPMQSLEDGPMCRSLFGLYAFGFVRSKGYWLQREISKKLDC